MKNAHCLFLQETKNQGPELLQSMYGERLRPPWVMSLNQDKEQIGWGGEGGEGRRAGPKIISKCGSSAHPDVSHDRKETMQCRFDFKWR